MSTKSAPKPPKRRTRGKSEGSIYQRASDGKWVATVNLGWRNGKRQRKYLYGATRAEVAAKLTEALAQRDRGITIKHERQTLGALLDQWHTEVVTPNLRPNTARTYDGIIRNHILPDLGAKPLQRLTAQDVQRLLTTRRAAGLKPETLDKVLSVLRLALAYAERLDLVSRNVATLVDRPRIERFEPNPLLPEEARALLDHVAADRLSALYEVSIRLGLRQGEALGLRWRDVNLETGLVQVRHQLQRIDGKPVLAPPKTERSRRAIELSPSLTAALAAHHRRQHAERDLAGHRWRQSRDWDLVFCSTVGTPLFPQPIGEHLKAALAATGLAPRRWHDLRHTAVTLMLAAGVPERVIMEIMGHSVLTMTRLYGRVVAPLRLDALSRVEDLLGPPAAS